MLKKSDGEASGGDGPFFSDGESGDGDSCWHLGDGEKGVETAEGFACDRNSEDGKGGEGRNHTWEMGGTACAGEDQSEATFFGRSGVGQKAVRGSMCADDAGFGRDSGSAQKDLGGAESGPVGATAHEDGDLWGLTFQDRRA